MGTSRVVRWGAQRCYRRWETSRTRCSWWNDDDDDEDDDDDVVMFQDKSWCLGVDSVIPSPGCSGDGGNDDDDDDDDDLTFQDKSSCLGAHSMLPLLTSRTR